MSRQTNSYFQLSIRDLCFLILSLFLVLALVLSRVQVAGLVEEINNLGRELDASRPIPLSEVADQFKSELKGYKEVEISQIWYRRLTDSYKIEFGWDDGSGVLIGYSVELESDSNGNYSTVIYDPELEMDVNPKGIKVVVGGEPPLFAKKVYRTQNKR